jgi:SAM-dependent methyltransferase
VRQASKATRESWNRHWAEREPPDSAEPHPHLRAAAASLAPGRALDLACGLGRNAVWLAERGWQVTAVDFSEVAIEHARRLAEASGVSVEWTVGDLRAYDPERGAFDLVLLFFLHVPAVERNALLHKAVAAVAPGGTFLLAAHDRRNLAEGARGPKNPEVLYSPEDVLPELEDLEVELAQQVLRAVETPEGERVMVDALVRARRPG